jgi:hypothetical protein
MSGRGLIGSGRTIRTRGVGEAEMEETPAEKERMKEGEAKLRLSMTLLLVPVLRVLACGST